MKGIEDLSATKKIIPVAAHVMAVSVKSMLAVSAKLDGKMD